MFGQDSKINTRWDSALRTNQRMGPKAKLYDPSTSAERDDCRRGFSVDPLLPSSLARC